jgi:hypothetical protein
MELDELKTQLNQRIEGSQQHSTLEITVMLHKQASSVVRNIEKSLWVELTLSVVVTLLCIVVSEFVSQWSYQMVLLGSGVIGTIFSSILALLIWKTKKLNNSNLSVKSNLETIISIIHKYVWLYLRLGIGLIPFIFGIALWLGYHREDGVYKPFQNNFLIYSVAGLAIFSYLSFRFTKWYLQKLYGNYTLQLEKLLRELDSDQ